MAMRRTQLGDERRRGGSGPLAQIGLGRLARAPDTVGVLAVEGGAVLSGVGDVVAHPGQPLERDEGLEVAPQERVHPGAVEDGLLAVEVDEFPE